jgi:hypothetical protein
MAQFKKSHNTPSVTSGSKQVQAAANMGTELKQDTKYAKLCFSDESRKQLDVKLTYSASIPDKNGIWPSISADGDQVYIVIQSYGENNPIKAQLYDRAGGTLQLKDAVLFDPTTIFTWVFEGHASHDFAKFTILESNGASGGGSMRVSILDKHLNPSKSRIITDPLLTAPAAYIYGGYFTEDNKYILVGYTGAPNDTSPYVSVILLLDANDLSTVVSNATNPIPRGVFPYPIPFTLIDDCGKKHLYFPWQSAGINIETGAFEPPYYSQVYKITLKKKTIKKKASVPLPQYSETDLLVRDGRKEALLSHGGFCSVFPDQLTVYDVNTPAIQSTLKYDNAEARVLLFNGRDLELVVKESTSCCTRTVAWPPGNGKKYFIGQITDVYAIPGDQATQSPGPVPEFWNLADLEEGCNGPEFRPQNLPRTDVPGTMAIFSQDGKWLLRVGLYGYNVPPDFNPLPDSLGIHNINLFRVTDKEYNSVSKIK